MERIEHKIREAIEVQVDGLAEDGERIAEPGTLALESSVRGVTTAFRSSAYGSICRRGEMQGTSP